MRRTLSRLGSCAALTLSMACGGPSPEPASDAGAADAARATDGAAIDTGSVGDTGSGTDTGLATDAGESLTAEAFCAHVAACGGDAASCITGLEAQRTRSDGFGCAAEQGALDACLYAQFVPDPSGTCHPDATACDAVMTAYNHCIVAASGVDAQSCASGASVCVTFHGSGYPASALCASPTVPVDACPSAGIVGHCATHVPGDVTVETIFYGPLVGVTVADLERSCTSGGGTWTAS